MSYITYKRINGKKYAYETTSYWDPELKRTKKKHKYFGVVDQNNNIISKIDRKKENLILDFGDGYLLTEFIKKSDIFSLINKMILPVCAEFIPIVCYRLCMQSAMYNCNTWAEANIIQFLWKDVDLSSQNISSILATLSSEKLQREFFEQYLKLIGGAEKSVIIDATSLPNQIHTGFNAWGRSDGHIEKQFRFLCVVEQEQKIPLYYRYLPGNLSDVSTLKNTIQELHKIGVKNSYILLDAGYFSESNIRELYQEKIDFLTRLPSSRKIYKYIISKKIDDLENIKHAVKYDKRILFVKRIKTKLYDQIAYAYIVLDHTRKHKELNEFLLDYLSLTPEEQKDIESGDEFNKCGIMILFSSKELETSEVVPSYYMRQTIEQVFSFMKSDLDMLPIRRHNEDTIRGYLFLQFIVLLVFIQLRNKLEKKFTVEQALLQLRNLKCKVYDKQLVISELTKKQREIFELCSILVPKFCGI